MFRLFCVGEYVDLGGVVGIVLSVQIFFIIMCIVDGKIIVILNGKIIVGNIINFFCELVCCNEFIIGVVYDFDIDQVKQILINIIQFEDCILKDCEMIVCLNEFGVLLINFVVCVWSNSGDL